MVTRDTLSHKSGAGLPLSLRCAAAPYPTCSIALRSLRVGLRPALSRSTVGRLCVCVCVHRETFFLAPTHFPQEFSDCCECGLERDLISGDSDTVHTDTPTRTRLRVKVQRVSRMRESRQEPSGAMLEEPRRSASCARWRHGRARLVVLPASHERRRLRHAPAAAADRHSRRDEDGQARHAHEGDRQVLGRGLGRRQAELVGRGLRLQGGHLR